MASNKAPESSCPANTMTQTRHSLGKPDRASGCCRHSHHDRVPTVSASLAPSCWDWAGRQMHLTAKAQLHGRLGR